MNDQGSNAQPALPFAEAVRAGDLLFLSGQIGVGESNEFGQEVRQVMENIGRVLQEHTLHYANLVSVSIYLTDMADYAEMNKIYSGFFQGGYPSRVCVTVKELAMHARIEISAIASFTSK